MADVPRRALGKPRWGLSIRMLGLHNQGTTSTADSGAAAPITAPAGGTVSDTLALDKSVPASTRSLNVAWAEAFSLDQVIQGSVNIKGVPLPG